MFILGMHPGIDEENTQRELSRQLKVFLFLGFWQYVVPPNFLI